MSGRFPWSFYAVIGTFALFFGPLNIYIFTTLLSHPWSSPLWLIISIVGLAGLLYSIRMMKIHQQELIKAHHQKNSEE